MNNKIEKTLGLSRHIWPVLLGAALSCGPLPAVSGAVEKAREPAGTAPAGRAITEAGTGWSTSADPVKAAAEAVAAALDGKSVKHPDFAVLIANAGGPYLEKALAETRRLLGGKTRIYGGSSDSRGLVLDKGFVRGTSTIGYGFERPGPEKALALMTVASGEIRFGVGYAEFSPAVSPRDGTKLALLMALKSAGAGAGGRPKAVLVTPSFSDEEAVLAAIKEFFGFDVPVVGGTAGGPVFGIIGDGRVFEKGVSLALLYTGLPVGVVSVTGFKPQEIRSGTLTAVETNGSKTVIRGIDGRPAWTVYNEWLKGEPENVLKTRGNLGALTDYTALNPIFRQFSGKGGQIYYIYSHPLVDRDTIEKKAFYVYSRFRSGEKVYLTSGSWGTVLNTVWAVPDEARRRAGIKEQIFSIGHICAGLLGAVPEEERDKMRLLLADGTRKSPFLMSFSWGEEGYYPGVGNRHGNLTVTFLTVGKK